MFSRPVNPLCVKHVHVTMIHFLSQNTNSVHLNLWIIDLHSIFSNANPLNSQIILLSVLIYDLATTGALFKPQLFESQFQDRTESDGQIYGS